MCVIVDILRLFDLGHAMLSQGLMLKIARIR